MTQPVSYFQEALEQYQEMLSQAFAPMSSETEGPALSEQQREALYTELFSGAALDAEPDASPKVQAPAPGQIWSTYAHYPLSDPLLAEALAEKEIEAGFLRLFLVMELGVLHLGQYQVLQLCPLNDFMELASDADVILTPESQPFDEPLMLETWNQISALSSHLEHCHGSVQPQAWEQIQLACAGRPHRLLRGGQIMAQNGPHAQFRQLEMTQLNYLQIPLKAVTRLAQQSQTFTLRISPQALIPPQNQSGSGAHPLFPQRLTDAPERTLAASSDSEALSHQAGRPGKERLHFSQDCLLDIWLDDAQLEFFAFNPEGHPLTSLRIAYLDLEGKPQECVSDSFGSAFIPVKTLYRGASLLRFFWQNELLGLYPIEILK